MTQNQDWSAERIADRMAIQDALHRYCRGVDRIHLKTLASVFHDDAVIDNGAHRFSTAEFVDNVGKRHPGVPYASHMVMNTLIDFLGPERAFVETWGLALEQHPSADGKGPAIDRVHRVRYGDVFEKRKGEWRVARRINVIDHILNVPVDPALSYPAMANRLYGRRDAQDPISRARAALGLPD